MRLYGHGPRRQEWRRVFERVRAETGFHFQILSGDEEARLTFLGALLPGMRAETSAVIDIGGGSTELIAQGGGRGPRISGFECDSPSAFSNPIPSPTMSSGPARTRRTKCSRDHASLARKLPAGTQLVAVAGTATTLAAWHLELPTFDARRIDELTLTRGDVHRMVEELKWRTVKERCALPAMEPKRADVILAGALILWRAMETLKFAEIRVSTRGLRYGALKQLSSAFPLYFNYLILFKL